STFLDNQSQPIMIAGVAVVYAGAWLFLAGGIIDRYARDRRPRTLGFFAASGGFFFRFLRLAVLMALVYGALFRYLHPWLFESVYPNLTRDITVERTAFVIRVALYVVFGASLAACTIEIGSASCRERC